MQRKLLTAGVAMGLIGGLAVFSSVPAQDPPAKERLGPLPRDQRGPAAGREIALPAVQRDAMEYVQRGQRLLDNRPRIFGGAPAPVGAYPWQVSISLANAPPSLGHFCGGSIIAANWVLTAAHCLDGTRQPSSIQIVYGTNFLSQATRTAQVAAIIVHESWNRPSFDYNVALVRTVQSLDPTPIRLVQAAEAGRLMPVGVLATVSGWGLTQVGGSVSDVLQDVGVQVTSPDICNSPPAYAGAITERMVCAGFAEGGRDSCQGDSGGPLMVVNQQGSFALAGIVSWGEGCARPNKFGVYTRVPTIAEWAAQKMQ